MLEIIDNRGLSATEVFFKLKDFDNVHAQYKGDIVLNCSEEFIKILSECDSEELDARDLDMIETIQMCKSIKYENSVKIKDNYHIYYNDSLVKILESLPIDPMKFVMNFHFREEDSSVFDIIIDSYIEETSTDFPTKSCEWWWQGQKFYKED